MSVEPFVFAAGMIVQFSASVVYTLHVWRPNRVKGSQYIAAGLWTMVAWFFFRVAGVAPLPLGLFPLLSAVAFLWGSSQVGIHLARSNAEKFELLHRLSMLQGRVADGDCGGKGDE